VASFPRIPAPEREFHFAKKELGREWRFDFAWRCWKVAVEIEGVTYPGDQLGRHQSATGFVADCEKYNAATMLGWRVLRLVPAVIQKPNPGPPLGEGRPTGVYQVQELLKDQGMLP
jgi:hypothetical protein